MKPWEETWKLDDEITAVWGDGRLIWQPSLGYEPSDRERMRLAAAAPEMARLLLKINGSECLPGHLEDAIPVVLRKAGVL